MLQQIIYNTQSKAEKKGDSHLKDNIRCLVSLGI